MFFKYSPDLWFKVVDPTFDENEVFSKSFRFRVIVLKLNSSQLKIVKDLLHGSYQSPYSEMKRLLTEYLRNYGNYGI